MNSLQELLDDPNWLKEAYKKVAEEMKAERLDRENYLNSQEFQDNYYDLVEYLLYNNSLSTDCVWYFEDESTHYEKLFIKLYEGIRVSEERIQLDIKTDCPFPEEFFRFRDLSISIMYGQGASFTVKLISKE